MHTAPLVTNVSNRSPIEITLIGAHGLPAAALFLVIYVLKDPKLLGGWYGRLRESYHDGMRKAQEAKDKRRAEEAEAAMRDIERRAEEARYQEERLKDLSGGDIDIDVDIDAA